VRLTKKSKLDRNLFKNIPIEAVVDEFEKQLKKYN